MKAIKEVRFYMDWYTKAIIFLIYSYFVGFAIFFVVDILSRTFSFSNSEVPVFFGFVSSILSFLLMLLGEKHFRAGEGSFKNSQDLSNSHKLNEQPQALLGATNIVELNNLEHLLKREFFFTKNKRH